MPRINGVLETCIHVDNVGESARFYEDIFEFHRMGSDDRFCAFDVAGVSVLLLFRKGDTPGPIATPGGVIPPHGGDGDLHFAFAVAAEDLAAWERRLLQFGVAIESRVDWPLGGRSIYFRDPDHHLVELATPGTWPSY